jgi:uncharacterized protein YjaG (DUF416 family)
MLPDDISLRYKIIEFCKRLGNIAKLCEQVTFFIDYFARKNEWDSIKKIISTMQNDVLAVQVHQHIIVALDAQQERPLDLIMMSIDCAIEGVLTSADHEGLRQFLSALQAVDSELYDYACERVKQC